MKKCIVIIPVYKAAPDLSEKASFRQTLRVLNDYDICVVTFKDCDLGIYESISESEGKSFERSYFDKLYFRSVDGYNELCLSSEFYERFEKYQYMLICQLDVWLFHNHLDSWLDKDYDYVGAPIFYAYNKNMFTDKALGVGNGGFSLRKIAHCLKITRHNRYVPFVKPWELIRFYWNLCKYDDYFTSKKIRKAIIIPTLLLKFIGVGNNLSYYKRRHVNEDLIFGRWSDKSWGCHAKLPSVEEAASFSFEVNPSRLYGMTCQLPFGCHAFMKWEYDSFWKQFITIDEK